MARKSGSRNANGMGSIRQRKNGSWEGRYTDPEGRSRSVYAPTKSECSRRLRAALQEIDSGHWLKPRDMTMDEWLDAWVRDFLGHTTGRTRETYANVARLYLRPVLGSIPLQQLSVVHVRSMITHVLASHSPATAEHARVILCSALKSAIEAGLIRENVAHGIKTPRIPPKQMTVLDRDQFPDFFAAAAATRHADELVFLLYTGLRVGELQALAWQDVDFARGTLRVARQLHLSKGEARFAPPKNAEVRQIVLTASALDLLRAHRKAQLAARLAAGEAWQDTDITRDLIFRTPAGAYIARPSIRKSMLKIRKALDLPALRIHDLRHSYAVAALRSGADIKTVQHNLGHRSAAVTLDIYAAYTTDAGQVAAQRLDAWFTSTHTP